jgi:four helix bundle protein
MDFLTLVYRHTAHFPSEERFGLTNQVRRSSVSIPSNIAEGQGRRTTTEFLHFLSIARGSLQEAETQILIAQRLTYLGETEVAELLGASSEVGRLLSGLINSLERTLFDKPLPTSH